MSNKVEENIMAITVEEVWLLLAELMSTQKGMGRQLPSALSAGN